ncbi:hypothetical protein BD779DRAFT_1476977 [Infundibulicybe gibba]|nr:hypothetical protein BD779DRAFT_1476977 [Infundibulicybe gibba]
MVRLRRKTWVADTMLIYKHASPRSMDDLTYFQQEDKNRATTTWYGSHSGKRFKQSQLHFLRRPSPASASSARYNLPVPLFGPYDAKTAPPSSPPHAVYTSPRSPHDARSRGARCARTPTSQHRAPVRPHPSAEHRATRIARALDAKQAERGQARAENRVSGSGMQQGGSEPGASRGAVSDCEDAECWCEEGGEIGLGEPEVIEDECVERWRGAACD